jgi:hypothetical protein
MTKSGSENEEVLKAAEAALQESGETVIMAVRGSKNRGIWGVSGRLARHMSKPRVIALTSKSLNLKLHFASVSLLIFVQHGFN